MDKKGFLKELKVALKGDIDAAEVITYYNELIDEAVLNGELESDVVKRLGSVSDIVSIMGKRPDENKVSTNKNKPLTKVFFKIIGLIAYMILVFMLVSIGFGGGIGFFTNLVFVFRASTVAVAFYYVFQMVIAVGLALVSSSLILLIIKKIKETMNWLNNVGGTKQWKMYYE